MSEADYMHLMILVAEVVVIAMVFWICFDAWLEKFKLRLKKWLAD